MFNFLKKKETEDHIKKIFNLDDEEQERIIKELEHNLIDSKDNYDFLKKTFPKLNNTDQVRVLYFMLYYKSQFKL